MAEILIVEDDRHLRFVIRLVLEQGGYQVTEAHDGLDALSAIAKSRPAVVIADLKMPVMSGAALIERLREDPGTANIPIVVVTGNSDIKSLDGVNSILTKPFDAADLLRAVTILQAADGQRGA